MWRKEEQSLVAGEGVHTGGLALDAAPPLFHGPGARRRRQGRRERVHQFAEEPFGRTAPTVMFQEIGGRHDVGPDAGDEEEVVEQEFAGTLEDDQDDTARARP